MLQEEQKFVYKAGDAYEPIRILVAYHGTVAEYKWNKNVTEEKLKLDRRVGLVYFLFFKMCCLLQL